MTRCEARCVTHRRSRRWQMWRKRQKINFGKNFRSFSSLKRDRQWPLRRGALGCSLSASSSRVAWQAACGDVFMCARRERAALASKATCVSHAPYGLRVNPKNFHIETSHIPHDLHHLHHASRTTSPAVSGTTRSVRCRHLARAQMLGHASQDVAPNHRVPAHPVDIPRARLLGAAQRCRPSAEGRLPRDQQRGVLQLGRHVHFHR